MQPLQSSFLTSSIIPGQVPIFIVAPEVHSGRDVAIMLSQHLLPAAKYRRLSGVIDKENNYFYCERLKPVLKNHVAGHKIQDIRLQAMLTLEEGMSNGTLWGLVWCYSQFKEFDIQSLFEQAYFVFLYSEYMPEGDAELLLKYKAALGSACCLIHADTLERTRSLVLQHLPIEAAVAETSYTPPAKTKSTFIKDQHIRHKLPTDLYSAVKEADLLLSQKGWFDGSEVSFILRLKDKRAKKQLLSILSQLRDTFVSAPKVLIFGSTEVIAHMREELATDQPALTVSFHAFDVSLAHTLNHLIAKLDSPTLVIGNLNHNYSVTEFLSPLLEKDEASFSFTLATVEQQSSWVSLPDVLTSFAIDGNLAIQRSLWQELAGFDESFTDNNTFWDFAIRALSAPGSCAFQAFATQAPVPGSIDIETTLENKSQYQATSYGAVINKHYDLFQEHLSAVIRLVSERQHLPQSEIRVLQQKIQTLQSLLSHSKKERIALNELNTSLQERISALEQRWYYRLGKKLGKIKKIFFKKKAPGKSILKSMLEFLHFAMSRSGFRFVRKFFRGLFKRLYLLAEDRPVRIVLLEDMQNGNVFTYHDWIKGKLKPEVLRERFEQYYSGLTILPKFSIIMPVYDPPVQFLRKALESVLNQQYENWELCIADDCSPNSQVQRLLQVYAAKDKRIKLVLRKENGHISASSNSALALATGDYIVLMDHDDALAENCLFEVAKHLNDHPEHEIIYSDEDKINEYDRHSVPHFKPDWAPHSLLSRNYFGHIVVMKKAVVDAIGGFRLGFEGSQDYDLILRATEQTQKIGHIPKVLYHWRIHKKSAAQSEEVKPYAYIAAKKALEEALQRRQTPGEVEYLSGLRGYRIRYQITRPGKVSIIIPTKDQVKLTKNTIDSIFRLTDYPDFEVIVLNNNSTSPELFALMDHYTQEYKDRFRCIDASFPFNFAKLMNMGVAACDGDYLLFLNNDMEVIHEDWLSTMVSHAQHANTGAVGAKLLYPDDHVQHAGVIVGLGGIAGHAFVNAHKDDPCYFNYLQSMNNFSALTAACLMVRREVFLEVGGMTELFEVEYNDVDFCLKIQQAGYYNVYLPDVQLYHFESSTRGHPHKSKESYQRHLREMAMFEERWRTVIAHDPCYSPNLSLGAHDFSLNFSA